MPFIYKIYLGTVGASISTGMLTTYFVMGFKPLALCIVAIILIILSCFILFRGLVQQEEAIISHMIVSIIPEEFIDNGNNEENDNQP